MRRHWRTERRRLRAVGRLAPAPGDERAAHEHADLVAALNGLPAREREALLLHALAELSYTEIAEALDVPVGTVRSRLSRARDRIRRQLEAAVSEGVL